MKTTLTILITILFVGMVSAQHPVEYRPEFVLTEYQKLYAENLVKDTKTYQLKSNVKSVRITLLDRNVDTLTFKNEKLHEIKSYFEIYKFEFLPNKKLQTDEVKRGREYNENTVYIPKIDTTTKITDYYFDNENNKLLKIIESQSDSYGFHGETTTEKHIDSAGFLKQEVVYNIKVGSDKQMYWIKKYELNKKSNAIIWDLKYYSPGRDDEKGKLRFKGESYKKALYSNTIISEGDLMEGQSTVFDERGNIIGVNSYDNFVKSSPPNNYNFSYKYNENNELIEIIKNGSAFWGFYDNEITIFQYDNYDEQGNWQNITITTTDENGRYSELKYKREISYY